MRWAIVLLLWYWMTGIVWALENPISYTQRKKGEYHKALRVMEIFYEKHCGKLPPEEKGPEGRKPEHAKLYEVIGVDYQLIQVIRRSGYTPFSKLDLQWISEKIYGRECSANSVEACVSRTSCNYYRGFWSDGRCYTSVTSTSSGSSGGGSSVTSCSASNLSACQTDVDCASAGGFWDSLYGGCYSYPHDGGGYLVFGSKSNVKPNIMYLYVDRCMLSGRHFHLVPEEYLGSVSPPCFERIAVLTIDWTMDTLSAASIGSWNVSVTPIFAGGYPITGSYNISITYGGSSPIPGKITILSNQLQMDINPY